MTTCLLYGCFMTHPSAHNSFRKILYSTENMHFTAMHYHCCFCAAHFANIDVSHVKSNQQFCNKIWQAFKFATGHLGPAFQPSVTPEVSLKCNPGSQYSPTISWINSKKLLSMSLAIYFIYVYHFSSPVSLFPLQTLQYL